MALAERLSTPTHTAGCKVAAVLASLDNEDQAVLERALANPLFGGRQIAVALRFEGHPVGRTTIQDHRNKVCSCVE